MWIDHDNWVSIMITSRHFVELINRNLEGHIIFPHWAHYCGGHGVVLEDKTCYIQLISREDIIVWVAELLGTNAWSLVTLLGNLPWAGYKELTDPSVKPAEL